VQRTRPISIVLFVLLCAALPPTQATPLLKPLEVNALPSEPADHRIPYGPGPEQFADLRLPPGEGPHPVAVVIHGGCWKKFADLANTAPMSEALRDAGIATWNVEFRRVDSEGGGWPATLQDIAQAVDHLRAIAPRHRLDLDDVVVVGHSAGGQLALWAAARHRLMPESILFEPDPLRLRGAVNLAGPGDLRTFPAEHQQSVCGDVPIPRLLGGSPDQVPTHYRDASPIELLPLGVAQVLISGGRDTLVPPIYAERYRDAAAASGDRVTLQVLDDAGHFELIAPTTDAWRVVERAVKSLLRDRRGGARGRRASGGSRTRHSPSAVVFRRRTIPIFRR
jgi:acetyl esterase/lipase